MAIIADVLRSRPFGRICPLALGFSILLCLAESSCAEDTPADIVRGIKAYEALFDHVRVRYHSRSGVEPFTVASSRFEAELLIDGRRMRQRYALHNARETTVTLRVTNGARVTEWTYSADDPEGGQAVVRSYVAPEPIFNRTMFQRHVNIDAVELSKIFVVNSTPAHVEVEFETGQNTRLRCRFSRFGEYLRTESYEPTWVDAAGQTQTGTQYYFKYREGVEPTLQNAGPIGVEIRAPAHGTDQRYVVDSVEFAPITTDQDFALTLPTGVSVDNRIPGLYPGVPRAITTDPINR